MNGIRIRAACPEDAAALLAIYRPYVEKTAISFEYAVPSEEEFRRRIAAVLETYPYIVAEEAGTAIGYAYAGPFHAREAYSWAVELSVYVAEEKRRCGIGKLLYARLEDILRKQGVLNLYACIAVPPEDDEYLTKNSMQFHGHLGYALAGTFKSCGRKFGRWYDMVYMEKIIGQHSGDTQPLNPFPLIRADCGL